MVIYALKTWICFIIALTPHEAAHAWAAWKCGDDTAKVQGRISLNPLLHMELVGTVILPLAARFLAMSGNPLSSFILGWGKPVPVNTARLTPGKRGFQSMLIAAAGPASNVVFAFLLTGLLRILAMAGASAEVTGLVLMLIQVNLVLCFFNLLPIPPLDGSHIVLRWMFGMGEETYQKLAQWGFLAVILIMQMGPVQDALNWAVLSMFRFNAMVFGIGV